MNQRVISIDIDGVLSVFESGVIPIVHRLFPGKIINPLYEPQDWAYSDLLTKDEFSQVWDEIVKIKGFWENLGAHELNVQALYQFQLKHQEDISFYYITSRPDTGGECSLAQTQKWLLGHQILPYNSSVLVVRDPTAKRALLTSIGASASIDDYLPTAISSSQIENHTSYLLDRPWNRKDRPVEGKLRVVSSLREFLGEQGREMKAHG